MSKEKDVEIAEISSIMANKSGRSVIWRILQITGIDDSTFNPDPITHAYNAGAREKVGIPLREMIKEAAPGEYQQMIKEKTSDA